MSGHLFDPGPAEIPVTLSAGAKRTLRNNQMIAKGIHPATRLPIVASAGTCKTCVQFRLQGGVAGRFFKCALNNTGGAATDIRANWPACTRYEPEDQPTP